MSTTISIVAQVKAPDDTYQSVSNKPKRYSYAIYACAKDKE